MFLPGVRTPLCAWCTDPYLHGAGSVGALLSQYGVQFVFNGHAHIYERNTKQPRESFVPYVAGGGGATLEPVGTAGCASYDAYAIGWSPTKLKGYKCGSAPLPTSASSVFSFLLVTVNGNQVTITPPTSSAGPSTSRRTASSDLGFRMIMTPRLSSPRAVVTSRFSFLTCAKGNLTR
jgi:hypothetical protein